jgi:hypothetical protein
MSYQRKVHDGNPSPTPSRANTYTFIASDDAPDLAGDRIDQRGWILDDFKRNPSILASHEYKQFPVGRAADVWVAGNALRVAVEFPPRGISGRADEAHGLVREGFLRSVSVGFQPGEYVANAFGGVDFTSGHRLLEISLTGTPMNPRALRVEDEVKMRGWLTSFGWTGTERPRPIVDEFASRRRAAAAIYATQERVVARTRHESAPAWLCPLGPQCSMAQDPARCSTPECPVRAHAAAVAWRRDMQIDGRGRV